VAAGRENADKLKTLDETLSAKPDYWSTQVRIAHWTVAAWLAHAEGKSDEAVKLMRQAADLDDATGKHPVTPGPILPARELLGDLLLELRRPAEALQEFEAALRDSPNRLNALYGAARAAELAGNREKARSYYMQLVALGERGDGERAELQAAKAFLAKN
jgi:tetratricopeptide (TPR) repeat protein